jgi:type IV pilus assembly protein PilV
MRDTRHDQGYSLLEVLISLIILAIGLLGLAGLQIQGLKANHSSFLHSQATVLAADIFDRMQSNRQLALSADSSSNYNVGFGSVPSKTGMAQLDLFEWKTVLGGALPGGDGLVDVNTNAMSPHFGTATIIIQWQDIGAGGSFIQLRTDSRL